MNTSYFSKIKYSQNLFDRLVCIASSAPPGFTGRFYKPLAPPWELIKAYKMNGDEQRYTGAYNHMVLKDLDPQQVYNDLGEDAILLCWEGKNKFCHRHLVSKWFEKELGIIVTEL